MTTDDTTDWKAAYFALAEVCKTETGWLRERGVDIDAERARHAALVAAARTWVDYWTAQEATAWDPAMTGEALHLMVRQFRAALDGEPR